MSVSLPVSDSPAWSVAPRALKRWATERVHRHVRPDGGVVYTFTLAGSTCNNRPLEAIMAIELDAGRRIVSATSQPAPSDTGCAMMCAVNHDARRFFAHAGRCDDVIGLTLHQAAFRDWRIEPSGCFCTAGNREHKWRNVFQTLYFAELNSLA